ncbi:trimethylamine methyltransferase family protein [Kiloniella laminariae]|uniref:Methyltransferase n=1 Tax=Kiloniella laminariae TaxID=454162 RepID=A0ABT4LPU7_9PROT|nr:trimethylamine methyltransferase family protein [Kiloniella laminariae]MCZ4283056.1 trimethylamine methyltransferase family protein [Kiloniella laminariae]
MTKPGSRRRGQRTGRSVRDKNLITQQPWKQIEYQYQPQNVLSEDQIEAIHEASLTILEDIGVKVHEPEARRYLEQAGAKVDHASEMVYLDRGLVEEKLKLPPSEFTLHARNPARNVKVGGKHAIFASVGGPAFVSDLDKGRRQGTYAEMCDFIRLVQSLNILHQEGGGPFEAMDLPQESRHLDLHYAQATLTDKNWQPWGLGQDRARDGLEMGCIALGITREELVDKPVFTTVINTNSPLQIDIPMAEGLIEMALHGQPVIITPFTLAGAMSPITLAGALTQQNAEALSGIVLAQCVRPGTPVIYGGFTSNVDMKTGSPAFGTPEYTLAAQASGQFARRYGVPFRSSNVTSSNAVDAQAAYESQMSIWGAMTGHVNLLNQGAGWLGGGLVASFEKLIIDAEMLQMMSAYNKPLAFDDDAIALDTIREVGPSGHFFGTSHTLARYEDAFYAPMVSDWDNYENWIDRGSLGTAERANKVWKKLLSDYEQPEIDPAIDEALQDYMARRKQEIHGKTA